MDKNKIIKSRYVFTMRLLFAVAFVLALAALRVGAAELAAMAVLLREIRQWNHRRFETSRPALVESISLGSEEAGEETAVV